MCLTTMGKHRYLSILFLRIAVGAVFMVAGYMKWSMWMADPASLPALMKFLAVVEPLGGVALILGMLTRWAALGLGIIMVGATYTKLSVMGLPFMAADKVGWSVDVLLLAACIVLICYGGGQYSFDVMTKWEKRE